VIYPVLVSRLPLIALAALFNLTRGAANPGFLLLVTFAIFAFFFFGDGLVGVPWHDICARTIPPRLRGRFFGTIQLVGGLLGLVAGELVRRTLADQSLQFPFNYGRLFVYLVIGMAASTIFVALIREPRGGATAEAQSLRQIIRAIPSTLRRYPLLRRLIAAQVLCGIPALAMPFYALYATDKLGLAPSAVGRFIQAAIIGSAASSMVWAFLSDRLGSTRVIRGVCFVICAVPLSALAAPVLARALHAGHAMAYLYAVVFLLNGCTWGGIWIGFTNYVLEIAPDDIRPLFLGLQATLASPVIVMPLLGGWLLAVIGFEALFAIAALGGVIALAYAHRLHEPRHVPRSGRSVDIPCHQPLS
jgi:Na+/melibiose symporter-like transporter